MITVMDDAKKLLWVDTLDEAYVYNVEATFDRGMPADILKGIKESGLENLKIAIPVAPGDYRTMDYDVYYQGKYYPTALEHIIKENGFSSKAADFYLYHRNVTKNSIASEDMNFDDKEAEEEFKAIARIVEDPSVNPFTKEECYTFSHDLKTGGKVPRM